MHLDCFVSSNCREQKKLPPKIAFPSISPANSNRRAIVYAMVLLPEIACQKSQWRHIALSTPMLWSVVTVEEDQEFNSPVGMLAIMYLERSKAAPLGMYCNSTEELLRVTLPVILKHAYRWREFVGWVTDAVTFMETIFAMLPHPAALLTLTHFIPYDYNWETSHNAFPPIHLPAIRRMDFPDKFKTFDFSLIATAEQIDFSPSSLTGLDCCTNLRRWYCDIRSGMVVEPGFNLHFPPPQRARRFSRTKELATGFTATWIPLVLRPSKDKFIFILHGTGQFTSG